MINTVQVVKLLGFYIQGDIKWNSHVTEMQKKAAKRLVQLKSVQWPPEEVHYSDALSRSGLGTLQQKTELGNKRFDKVVENPLMFCTLSYHSTTDPLATSGTLHHTV